jgi:hypothetical protein
MSGESSYEAMVFHCVPIPQRTWLSPSLRQEQMPGETPGPGSYTQVRRVRCGSWRAGQKVEHNPHGN